MPEPALLSLDGLTKRYGAVIAVEGLCAAIRRGELVSFVGPSGCGKTTLLRLIGGFLRPDTGRIVL
jgi:ABC-type Fe3+/spermidine/putrescine transport system ATPase subunit